MISVGTKENIVYNTMHNPLFVSLVGLPSLRILRITLTTSWIYSRSLEEASKSHNKKVINLINEFMPCHTLDLMIRITRKKH